MNVLRDKLLILLNIKKIEERTGLKIEPYFGHLVIKENRNDIYVPIFNIYYGYRKFFKRINKLYVSFDPICNWWYIEAEKYNFDHLKYTQEQLKMCRRERKKALKIAKEIKKQVKKFIIAKKDIDYKESIITRKMEKLKSL